MALVMKIPNAIRDKGVQQTKWKISWAYYSNLCALTPQEPLRNVNTERRSANVDMEIAPCS